MDIRLWTIFGMRPEPLTRNDVPSVARAIVGYYRGLVKLRGGFEHNVSFVLFQATGFQCLIRGDDWAKIFPFVKDGTLAPPAVSLFPWDVVTVANVDIYDPLYYQQVVGVLNGLFTVVYPTSYL